MASVDDQAYDKLFSRVEVKENGCWEYTRFRNPLGYGMLRYKGLTTLAHRLSYMLCIDDLPDDMCVLHKCDNPPCVNPEHLRIGTIADNTYDMVAKNRHAKKLTEDNLREIKAMLKDGIYHRIIAAKFGVSREAITKIANRS
jgi:hypothetical protein